MQKLTARQQKIFEFIQRRVSAGMPPTIREIGGHVGITSPNGVYCHLNALAKKGYILRDPLISRGIRLTTEASVSLPCQEGGVCDFGDLFARGNVAVEMGSGCVRIEDANGEPIAIVRRIETGDR